MQNPCIECPKAETCTDAIRKTCEDLKHYCDECDYEMQMDMANGEAEAAAMAEAEAQAEAEAEAAMMAEDGGDYGY